MKKVYFFGKKCDQFDDDIEKMEPMLGGKGSSLYKMSKMGIPVPPGMVIATEECKDFYQRGQKISAALRDEIFLNVARIENEVGKEFGNIQNPLLLSVRSGARFSMPGMMDTVLNLGLNDEILHSLLSNPNNSKVFILDCYRRFFQMYGNVVLKIPSYKFEEALSSLKMTLGVKKDSELTPESWKKFIEIAKTIIFDHAKKGIPQDPKEQLINAVEAVFMSWHNERAVFYRSVHNIPHEIGTAVNIQSMVFGNMNDKSATGVVFTRNPSNGQKEVYGEYLENAQGEDVVSGVRTPRSIKKNDTDESLEEKHPKMFKELCILLEKIESYYKDMQDIEFTIEDGKIWILQTRSGKRSIQASVKIAHDMAVEKMISKEDAILRIDVAQVHRLLHPQALRSSQDKVLAVGLPASPGVGIGSVVFNSKDAEEAAQKGESIVLVRDETSPEDVKGMYSSKGILTSCGGMTSHAAVVARGMGVCCVVGCESINIDQKNQIFTCQNGTIIAKGDVVTIDGNSGEIILGEVKMQNPEISEELKYLLNWCGEFSPIKVRANAEIPKDCEVGISFGMDGIGLCRTEHMFFGTEAIFNIRKAIIFNDGPEFDECLKKIVHIQMADFFEIFSITGNMPVNIRLLDPPLHEFLPNSIDIISKFARELGVDESIVTKKVDKIKESNPMLGNRGCRLGIMFPDIYKMQIKAILYALNMCEDAKIAMPKIEIMFPFVQNEKEVIFLNSLLNQVIEECLLETKMKKPRIKVGTMIELPRACLVAEKIAKHVNYFSFGTNDLTQTTFGISRDDCKGLLSRYKELGIISTDPFASLDQEGVGKLIEIAIESGKKSNPSLSIGVCGEHGGDVLSIEFFSKNNLDYVSCSPYRIPIAKLALAQNFITKKLEVRNEKTS